MGRAAACPAGCPPRHSDTTPTGSTTRLVQEHKKNSNLWGSCLCQWLGSLMVSLSLACSLGNILRLPRIARTHGAGTFLVMYGGVSLVLGLPLAFLEVLLGQFCQEGTTKLWRAVPLLKGVGYVKMVASFLLAIYYPAVMAIGLFFALWTIKGPLPFLECNKMGEEGTIRLSGDECLPETFLKPPDEDPMWFGVVVTLLFLIWAFVMLSVSRGMKSVRFSAGIVTVLSITCLVAIITQQINSGAKGYNSLLKFSWEPLKKFETWYSALIQLFLSTHLGLGNVTALAGNVYSKTNAFWTAVFYVFANLVVGLGGVVMASLWWGELPEADDRELVVPQLYMLTLAYDASATLAYEPQLWAAIAYLLFILSGFASMAALVYSIVFSIAVETKYKWRTWIITACVCAVSFILGILSLLPHKWQIFKVIDYYVIGRVVLLTTALELIGFLWIYGVKNLCNDFEFILGYKLSPLWNFLWFITPLILVGMEVASAWFLPLIPNEDPLWMCITGWSLYGAMWIILVICAIWQISLQVDYNLAGKIVSCVKPTRKWGPKDPMYRHGWVQWRDQYQTTGERDFTLKRRGTRDYTHSVKTEQRFNTMSLPRSSQSSYLVQLPHSLDVSDHVCWRKEDTKAKT